MKKLFAIRDTRTNKLIPELFFEDKTKAKNARNELNSAAGKECFVVTHGPDHWKNQ